VYQYVKDKVNEVLHGDSTEQTKQYAADKCAGFSSIPC
jgi:hypothetical protein